VRRQQHVLVREQRARHLRWLPELRRAAPDVLEAVDLATSFEAWVRLRTDQRLSRARAVAVVERTVTTLLNARDGARVNARDGARVAARPARSGAPGRARKETPA
jgi:hypothetical protein